MLKISRYGYNFGSVPVELSNRIGVPEEKPSGELSEEEKERLEEEKRICEEKQRFNDEVEKRVADILNYRRAMVDKEAQQILSAAKEQAQKLSEDTRAAAKNILDNAAAEGEAIKEKARRDGFTEGYTRGKAEAVKKCESYLEAAGQFLEEINSGKEAYYISNQEQMKNLVFEMAEKITLLQLDRDDKMIERIISKAAKSFRNSDFVRISVLESEVSREFVTDPEYIRKIVSSIPEIEVEYLSPEDNPPGTVILDNDSEIIDASVPTQLEFLQEILRKTRGDEPGQAVLGKSEAFAEIDMAAKEAQLDEPSEAEPQTV